MALMPTGSWGVTPRASIEAECARRGRDAVVADCRELLRREPRKYVGTVESARRAIRSIVARAAFHHGQSYDRGSCGILCSKHRLDHCGVEIAAQGW
jgi:hypothetical protein